MERYPDLPRKARETAILQEFPAVFIYGVGWILEDGYPHEMRAADYDDWVTETTDDNGKKFHGLNGDILVWNPVTRRRHELSSMGIRVTAETLQQQLAITGQLDFLKLPYHKAVVNHQVPLRASGQFIIGVIHETLRKLVYANMPSLSPRRHSCAKSRFD